MRFHLFAISLSSGMSKVSVGGSAFQTNPPRSAMGDMSPNRIPLAAQPRLAQTLDLEQFEADEPHGRRSARFRDCA
jgi:hypothetical protein